MDRSHAMLLPFLRALYEPHTPIGYPAEMWEQCLEEIRLFAVSSQVLSILEQSGRLEDTPAAFRERLTAEDGRRLPQNWFLKRKEEEALQAFERETIPAIPLKGTRFAEKYFGRFCGRLTGDIDLLIAREDLERSMDTLCEQGYALEKIIHNHAVMIGPSGFPVLELHWTLDKAGWSDLNPEPFWRNAEGLPLYTQIREMSVTDTFYFMCLHAVRHRADNVKYLLDLVQMLRVAGRDIDYEKLGARMAEDKTYRRVRTILSILYRTFPHLHAMKPLPFPLRRTAWSYRAIRDSQLKIRSLRYYLYRLDFKLLIFDTWKHRWHAQRKLQPATSDSG
jgi:hypothetical protein